MNFVVITINGAVYVTGMDYATVDFGKTGITERQVQLQCRKGKIGSVVWDSKVWLIPKDAPKPIDGRTKDARQAKSNKNEPNKEGD